jgi:hypothetical protein
VSAAYDTHQRKREQLCELKSERGKLLRLFEEISLTGKSPLLETRRSPGQSTNPATGFPHKKNSRYSA